MERREQGPPLGDPQYADIGNVVPFFLAFFFSREITYSMPFNFCHRKMLKSRWDSGHLWSNSLHVWIPFHSLDIHCTLHGINFTCVMTCNCTGIPLNYLAPFFVLIYILAIINCTSTIQWIILKLDFQPLRPQNFQESSLERLSTYLWRVS